LTPNGKVDRKALPQPERTSAPTTLVAPRTETETTLARIWADVLGLEHVGIHDNFFALGGDSILSIQIVARANQAGLHVTPGQLFQHQTVAELAAVATLTTVAEAEGDAAPGPVPLTPIQRWFFEQRLTNPQHFNQSLLLEPRQSLDFALLEQAVQHLARQHAALRLRFVRDAHGWQQFDPGDTPIIPCAHVDLSAVPLAEQPTAIEQAAADAQASLDLAHGPLMRVVLFDRGADQPQRVLLVIHHLVVDGVSWRILVDDLQTAYRQLARGEAVALPPRTTSFQRWAAQVSAFAQTDALHAELPYWLRLADRPLPRLPLDNPHGANLVATAREITLALDAEETRALLHDVPPVYHTQINDVLLTALIQGFAAWTGQHALRLDVEGHGREDLLAGVDLSRTVGWFTSVFPVALDLPHTSDPGAALKAVKEHLRHIPRRGIGYGLLRYLNANDGAAGLRLLPPAEINFNYLGQTDQSQASSLFAAATESSGPNVDPQAQRPYLLEISGIVSGGQLRLQWLYSEQLHHRATIEAFAQHTLAALRALIRHCLASEAGGYTPSDFPAARVSQGDLNKLLGMIGNKGGATPR
ncbi:MAG TPA: condensation domain-containing protein, partial [Herpetosiphonaceae bacterium]